MPVTTLQDLLVDLLSDTYDAEKQLVEALPRMVEAATAPELSDALREHLEVTRGQVTRLEQVFKELGLPVRGKHCPGMAGLIEEGKEVLEEDIDPAVLDAAIIAAAQKVEHYEIAAYGTARSWATQLGLGKAADLLEESLDEESDADETLTGVSEKLNVRAQVGE